MSLFKDTLIDHSVNNDNNIEKYDLINCYINSRFQSLTVKLINLDKNIIEFIKNKKFTNISLNLDDSYENELIFKLDNFKVENTSTFYNQIKNKIKDIITSINDIFDLSKKEFVIIITISENLIPYKGKLTDFELI